MRLNAFVSLLIALQLATGCGGGVGGLVVGKIQGPQSVDERSSAQYSVAATGDTGIAWQWAVDPQSAGTFSDPTSAGTDFAASPTSADISGTISVTVDSANDGPVVSTLKIVIKALADAGWVVTWGGADEDSGYAVAVDSAGDIRVSGRFEGTADCDPGTGEDAHTSQGGTDAFLTELDSSGEWRWSRTWGGAGEEEGFRVAADSAGSSYVVGRFEGAVDFDPGPSVDMRTSNGLQDAFLCKYDSSGTLLWARTWGGAEGNEQAFGLYLDSSGNILVSGFYRGTVDFDPGPGVDEHTGAGLLDNFLLKFDSSGNLVWSRAWGGVDWDKCYSIALDASGNIYLTGWFYGAVDFDPGPGAAQCISNGWDDIYLLKLNPSGDFLWVRTWGGAMSDGGGHVVVVGPSGNAYVTGHWRDTVDFDPGPAVVSHVSNGYDDAFVVSYSPEGDFRWVRVWGGPLADVGCGLDVDKEDNTCVTGELDSPLLWDPVIGDYTSSGQGDVFVRKYDATGALQWERVFAGDGEGRGQAIHFDVSGNIFVTGCFKGTIDFNPGDEIDNRTTSGGADAFLLRLFPDGLW